MNFKEISEKAVNEVVEELKKEMDSGKVDEAVKVIDAVNMIAEVVQSTIKDIGADPETLGEQGVKDIAKESAKAAILEAIKTLG